MAVPKAGPVTLAPEPKDVTDLQFRALRKIALSDNAGNEAAKKRLQCVDAASKFGKIAAACDNGFFVFDVAELEALDSVAGKDLKNTDIQTNELSKGQKVALPNTPTHLAFSADQLTLAAVVIANNAPKIYFYDTRAFVQGQGQPKPFAESSMMMVTPPGTRVNQLAWNPVLNSMLAVVYSNGSMALFMVAAEGSAPPDCCTLPPAEGITCVSWSPKGKQLVAG